MLTRVSLQSSVVYSPPQKKSQYGLARRLRAVPWTAYCVACQEEVDREQAAAAGSPFPVPET